MAPWVLHYSYKVSRIDLYDARGHHVAGGFDLAGWDGAMTSGALIVPEWALHGEALYVRISTVLRPDAVTIAPLDNVATASLQRRGTFGFFVGFFLAIGAFNLLMFWSLRDRPLLNFAGVMLLDAIRTSAAFGVFWSILPPLTFLGRELLYDTIATASTLALAFFAIDFLNIRRDRVSLVAVICGCVLALTVFITDFFPTTTVAFDWTFVIFVVFYATLFFAGVRAALQGHRSGTIFSVGIAFTIAGYALNMISYALPRQDLWVYALAAGQCLQALLLAMAVADSVQQSRIEHDRLVLESRNLEQLAMRDGLTGVLNRRSFDQAMTDASAAAVSGRERLGILFVDIDHFKEYNDTLGHQAGDEALRRVAAICAACVRGGDIFARYGGEEFAAIVPRATMDELTMIADRMRANLAFAEMSRADGMPLTISIGGASDEPSTQQAAYQILRAADAALYAAKSAGRDRIVMA